MTIDIDFSVNTISWITYIPIDLSINCDFLTTTGFSLSFSAFVTVMVIQTFNQSVYVQVNSWGHMSVDLILDYKEA